MIYVANCCCHLVMHELIINVCISCETSDLKWKLSLLNFSRLTKGKNLFDIYYWNLLILFLDPKIEYVYSFFLCIKLLYFSKIQISNRFFPFIPPILRISYKQWYVQDRRSMCINEIVETERNYVKHLNMMITKFIQPMKAFVSENDIRILFANTEVIVCCFSNTHSIFF